MPQKMNRILEYIGRKTAKTASEKSWCASYMHEPKLPEKLIKKNADREKQR